MSRMMASLLAVLRHGGRAVRKFGAKIVSSITNMSEGGLNVTLEALEPRILLSGDPLVYTATDAIDLTLRIEGQDAAAIVQLVNAEDQVVASQALSMTSGVQIIGSDFDDALRIDLSAAGLLPISFSGGLGVDTLFGAEANSTWNITGENSGDVGNVSFSEVENLIGAAANDDTFVFGAAGSLSGVVAGGSGGFDALVLAGGTFDSVIYAATSADAGTVTRDGDVITYVGLEPILDDMNVVNRVIGLTGLDNNATLSAIGNQITISDDDGTPGTFEGITFTNPSASLTIDGLGGDDQITINSMDLGSTDLVINAETIILAFGQTLSTTGSVTLSAVATGSVTSGQTVSVDLAALVQIDGTINAGGKVKLEASIDNLVDITPAGLLPEDLSITSVSSAIVDVASTATINAATLEVVAHTEAVLKATITAAEMESADISSIQTTRAGIAGGASITVGTGAISGSEPASVLVQALDESDIQTDITTGGIAAELGFDLVQSSIDLSRDTKAFIGDALSLATLNGPLLSTTGMVKVLAENKDGAGGGVAGTIDSNFLGIHTTTVSKDDAIASIENVDFDVALLMMGAMNTATYLADAKIARNTVTGVTKATINNSIIDAAPPSTDQGVTLSALDMSSYTARSGDFLAAAADIVSAFPSGFDLDIASAINEINKNTEASITNSANTITVTNGDVKLEAVIDMQVSATADAISITDAGGILPIYNLSVGGTFAANEVLGDATAYISDSTIITTGVDGDVLVSAINTSAVDATAEAGTTAAGGSSAALGAAVAFNAIGWDIDTFLLATLDALIGTELGATEEAGGSEAKAYISNSYVTAGGDVTVVAEAAAQINATVSNVSKSTGEALFGAKGIGIGGIVASNKVSSAARAFIEDIDIAKMLTAGGALTVQATDSAGIFANSKLTTSQVTTNTGGVNALTDVAASLIPATYRTDDLIPATSTIALVFGDTVELGRSFDSDLGEPGRVYEYLGEGGTPDDLRDLLTEDYTNLDVWKELLITQIQNGGLNLSNSNSVALGGMVVRNEVKGEVEAYIENAEVQAGSITVTASESATLLAIADATAVSSGGSSFGEGKSLAFNGVIAVNVVLSSADAHIADSVVTATAGDISVEASNSASLGAETKSAVNSGAEAIGIVLAFNTIGYESQNLLFDTFDALLGLAPNAFDFETTDTPDELVENDRVKVSDVLIYRYVGSDLVGPVDLTEGTQNYDTNTLNWILVTPAFGNENPSEVTAYVLDSTIEAAGNLAVTADNLSQLEARTGNNATAAASALFGASGMSV
ncbi:MAG: LEPR-XLL domain-containing protein, partial [Candidatus Hydrogenedentes bacterium]|nr:LEPR-XLL domain-containing protein [Candidatus Hydrogenedentota bacterium]